MAVLRDFIPENTSIEWGGIGFVGFGPDTFITVSRNTPNTASSVGADGSVGLTKSADRTGNIEITLMQTSSTNSFLSALQAAQDIEDAPLIRLPMTVSDPSGGFICFAEGVHIMNPPEVSLGSDQNVKTWSFFAERLIYADTPALYSQTAAKAAQVAAVVQNVNQLAQEYLDLID